MNGLKNVRNRRDDALTRVDWKQLEKMLADYYRTQGWSVDHVGTGGSSSRFDGGVDLKMRRGAEYILVQCKHWNAKQVPHNTVHELLGVKVNQNATGAIVITSGEFTQAAKDAAVREGHVQLIDGDALRAMLGPLPETSVDAAQAMHAQRAGYRNGENAGRSSASTTHRKNMRSIERTLRLVLGIVGLLVLVQCVPRYLRNLTNPPFTAPAATNAPPRALMPAPKQPPVNTSVVLARPPEPVQPQARVTRTDDQSLREWKRKNAESMRILEANDRRYEEALMDQSK